MTSKYAIAVAVVAVAVPASAAAAEARQPVKRAEVFAATQRLAIQAATNLEDRSAAGIEDLTNGAASVDRSRTSVGNYMSYGTDDCINQFTDGQSRRMQRAWYTFRAPSAG